MEKWKVHLNKEILILINHSHFIHSRGKSKSLVNCLWVVGESRFNVLFLYSTCIGKALIQQIYFIWPKKIVRVIAKISNFCDDFDWDRSKGNMGWSFDKSSSCSRSCSLLHVARKRVSSWRQREWRFRFCQARLIRVTYDPLSVLGLKNI